MRQDHFTRFEDQIQRMVEGSFARLLAGRLHPREVAVSLIRAMEDHAVSDETETQLAPNSYIIYLNPDDHKAITMSHPDLPEVLARELIQIARSANLLLNSYPEISLQQDANLALCNIHITAEHSSLELDRTKGMQRPQWVKDDSHTVLNAALLLGNQYISLEKPVINLGRHRENDIILDYARISRHHAQMRLRFGHYSIFDLGSKEGVTVNGKAVSDAPLQSGDVITLAGITLIYLEDLQNDLDENDNSITRPMNSQLPDEL